MERRVTREGQAMELTGKEFALLEFLMQARGRCCSAQRAAARGVADVSGRGNQCGGCVCELFAEEAWASKPEGSVGWRIR